MVVCLILRFKGGVLFFESAESLLTQRQVVEFVFEYYCRLQQTLHYNLVALSLLFVSKRNLCQIVFALMRIVDGRVHLSR